MTNASRCLLCKGSGENRSGFSLKVNDHICPRCGGYGTVPSSTGNSREITQQDMAYIRNNGIRSGPLPIIVEPS